MKKILFVLCALCLTGSLAFGKNVPQRDFEITPMDTTFVKSVIGEFTADYIEDKTLIDSLAGALESNPELNDTYKKMQSGKLSKAKDFSGRDLRSIELAGAEGSRKAFINADAATLNASEAYKKATLRRVYSEALSKRYILDITDARLDSYGVKRPVQPRFITVRDFVVNFLNGAVVYMKPEDVKAALLIDEKTAFVLYEAICDDKMLSGECYATEVLYKEDSKSGFSRDYTYFIYDGEIRERLEAYEALQ